MKCTHYILHQCDKNPKLGCTNPKLSAPSQQVAVNTTFCVANATLGEVIAKKSSKVSDQPWEEGRGRGSVV